MPTFEIQLDVYKVGPALNTKEFRRCLISNKNKIKDKFTREDLTRAISMIKKMMIEYNKGLRGGRIVYKSKDKQIKHNDIIDNEREIVSN